MTNILPELLNELRRLAREYDRLLTERDISQENKTKGCRSTDKIDDDIDFVLSETINITRKLSQL